jgi:hypothetical protein
MPTQTIDLVFELARRRPQRGSLLHQLPPNQLSALAEMLRSEMNYYQIATEFDRRFGRKLSVSFLSSLFRHAKTPGPSLPLKLKPGQKLLTCEFIVLKSNRIRLRCKSPLSFTMVPLAVPRCAAPLRPQKELTRQDLCPADQKRVAIFEPAMIVISKSAHLWDACKKASLAHPAIRPLMFYRVFCSWEASGRDWRALVDKRNYSSLWRRRIET